jgi:hypothetical protein
MGMGAPAPCFGLGEPQHVTTSAAPGSFALAHSGTVAKLWVDGGDWPGVIRAAHDLQADIQRVTGVEAAFSDAAKPTTGDVVLIGTIGKSAIIDRLIREHKIDVSEIRGKWEATLTQVVERPLPGVRQALVIAGSDKRGTIYGIYGLSEQIGVSPWYWWADVPVEHKDALYVDAGRWVEGEPAVKYRGIFLNDEAPALTGWVNEKYGGYNHEFYTKVFELLLRLRANFLWPADVEQLVRRRRSSEREARGRVRHRDEHLARRADDVRGEGVEARGWPVELHDEPEAHRRALARVHGARQELRAGRDAGHARRE